MFGLASENSENAISDHLDSRDSKFSKFSQMFCLHFRATAIYENNTLQSGVGAWKKYAQTCSTVVWYNIFNAITHFINITRPKRNIIHVVNLHLTFP
jgi:hypothetical protein